MARQDPGLAYGWLLLHVDRACCLASVVRSNMGDAQVAAVVAHALRLGADPDEGCGAALRAAAGCSRLAVLRLLLQRGASVDLADDETTALMVAAKGDCAEAARALLDGGASVDTRDFLDRTALMWAVLLGNLTAARVLLSAGASIHMKDCFGDTATISAAMHGHASVLEALLESGADPNAAPSRCRNTECVAALS
jgi:hypothetical protein